MPLYSVSTRAPLQPPKRERIARAIVDIHCGLTGAPPAFVNVMFAHDIPLAQEQDVYLLANVRKGRSDAANCELGEKMGAMLDELLQIPFSRQRIVILEIPARWVMEGGEVLPEPGEEASSKWGYQLVEGANRHSEPNQTAAAGEQT